MKIDWSRFAEIVNAGKRFVLTSHMRADCDAVGSELGMAEILETLGKEVAIVNGEAVPQHIAFIDPQQKVKVLGDDIDLATCAAVDVVMVLDTSAWVQLGPMADVLRQTSATKIVVDHHVSQDDFGAECFKDTQAEATGRLVIEAADALGVALTPAMATPLFAAIATDTGWFRFPSVDETTFAAIERLVASGARPHEIFAQLYERNTRERLLLRGQILANVESVFEGRLVFGQATQTDFESTGARPTDTEDVINMFLTVAGSQVAVLMLELPSGQIKVSLRSQGETDVRQVAEQFGGGGHRAASGVTLEGPIDEAKTRILDALRSAMS